MLFVLVITIFIIILYFVWYFITKRKESKNEFLDYLSTRDSFVLSLDTVKIDGFNWSENVAMDTYDNELDPNDDFLYRTSSYHSLKFKGKFHKNKVVTKFSSKLYIPINHKNKEKILEINLPIDHTIIRMKFFQKKTTKIYVLKKSEFLIDFTFLEDENITYIKV